MYFLACSPCPTNKTRYTPPRFDVVQPEDRGGPNFWKFLAKNLFHCTQS